LIIADRLKNSAKRENKTITEIKINTSFKESKQSPKLAQNIMKTIDGENVKQEFVKSTVLNLQTTRLKNNSNQHRVR